MSNGGMTDAETRAHLLRWCDEPNTRLYSAFSWATDSCGYDQHIKFVKHRNANWKGGSPEQFTEFVRQYALSLTGTEE